MNRIALSLFSLLLSQSLAFSAYASDLHINNAWIADAPPIATIRAGYMTLTNSSNEQITILSASSNAFARVEFHRSVNRDNMIFMDAVKQLVIPAGSRFELKPGSYHLMMFEPNIPLTLGKSVAISLTTNLGEPVHTQALIK